jgi:hypothetical protein
MKIGQTPKLSNANVSGKGHRPPKFSAPPVTSVNWGSVGQTFLTELAASKVGGISNLPIATDAINKIAFGCYSAKELPFILQGLGFASDYAVKKKDLLNQAIATFNSIHAMRNISSADKDKNLSTSPSAFLCQHRPMTLLLLASTTAPTICFVSLQATPIQLISGMVIMRKLGK